MGIDVWSGADARARVFASRSSWIEGAAVKQLNDLLTRPGALRVAGMPDLHPGHRGPVGCAALFDGVVHPDVIGTDIGCGMALFRLGGVERRLKGDKAERALARLGEHDPREGVDMASAAGLAVAEEHAASIGTIGGGNHFCELQAVERVVDEEACAAAGLEKGGLALLVHTGSRSFGAATYAAHRGVVPGGLTLAEAGDYLDAHDRALAFAALNRRLVADRAAAALGMELTPLADLAHNHVEIGGDGVLHRKGAAPADRGLAPVPGSRGALTYLVLPDPGVEGALRSIAHGAGRKRDRAGMLARAKDRRVDLSRSANPVGNRVICADKALAAEEAPEAYKDVRRVVADLEEHGLARVVATLRPIVTFKTAEA